MGKQSNNPSGGANVERDSRSSLASHPSSLASHPSSLASHPSPLASHPSPRARDTFWNRLFHGVCRVRHHARWLQFAGPDWLERIMDLPATDHFHAKQGRSTCRVALRIDGRELSVYLKRHYHLPRWQGWRALLGRRMAHSPAVEEWEHLHSALAAGLPVPAPLAAGEFIGPWGRLQSFLAIEELTGMIALHEAIPAAAANLEPSAFACWKRGLVSELVRLTCALHCRRLFHNDLYLCHFFIAAEDTARLVTNFHGRVALIDLHRLGRQTVTALFGRAKDLGQLLYSSDLQALSARDRLRFWQEYVSAEKLGWLSRRLLRLMCEAKAWVYHRNHRRKLRRKNG